MSHDPEMMKKFKEDAIREAREKFKTALQEMIRIQFKQLIKECKLDLRRDGDIDADYYAVLSLDGEELLRKRIAHIGMNDGSPQICDEVETCPRHLWGPIQ